MVDFEQLKSASFPTAEATAAIQDTVTATLENNEFDSTKISPWTSDIIDRCLLQLAGLNKPFKYIVTCVIMQKENSSLHTASSCYWNETTDGSCTVKWENSSMFCIVTCFGLSLQRESDLSI
ncbi:Dynein light chain Tctex-type [Echinococcus granulosus]|uniref:Dynein light chain Tctex-type n=1 Tax=Echinococcus granulosus TaxID=6210 RepID=W6U5I0_ECHGR|nr:Dynein light chain Tctex-type [Echinococcus granulosus]EUB56385.1 Dynein light chain Tctex-type [Echinococcus granulosus]